MIIVTKGSDVLLEIKTETYKLGLTDKGEINTEIVDTERNYIRYILKDDVLEKKCFYK